VPGDSLGTAGPQDEKISEPPQSADTPQVTGALPPCCHGVEPSGAVPLALHTEQRRVIEAWDALGPDGLPQYDELALLWTKKPGKSTTAGGLVVTELVGGLEGERDGDPTCRSRAAHCLPLANDHRA
jgi:hypothetical protein